MLTGSLTALFQGHGPLPLFIVQAICILLVSRTVGLLARRVGQPMVIAEILAGIMLGPSLLGWIAPGFYSALFPADSLRLLSLLAQFGLVLFMFFIGLELDPKLLRGRGGASLLISQAGILVPFAMGLGLAWLLYRPLSLPHVGFWPFALFCGIAMSITAFPVLARILSEWRLLRSKVGVLVITCAAINDVVAWCILAFVVSVVNARGMHEAVVTTLYTGGYIAFMLVVMRPFLGRFAARGANREGLTQNMVAGTFVLLLMSAWATDVIGIHALFGAFMLGTIVPKENGFATALADKLEDFVIVFLLPIFFAYSGLRTDIGSLNSATAWMQCGLIILVACVGKIGGSAIAARIAGQTWREAFSVGALMNTRGLMELVVLNIGLDLGVISTTLFTMLVLMAVVTTFMTTPLLHLIYPPADMAKQLATEDAGQSGGDGADKSLSSVATPPYCVLMAVSYVTAAGGMLLLAQALIRRGQTGDRLYALKLVRTTNRTSDLIVESGTTPTEHGVRSAFGSMLADADARGLAVKPISFVSSQPANDICSVADMKGADLIVLGWHRPLLNRAALGGTVNEVLEQAKTDVGVLVDRGLSRLRRVLVPYHGTSDDQGALAIAHRLYEQGDVDVTILHVVPPGRGDGDPRTGVTQQVQALFAGPESDARQHMKVVEHAEPAEAALAEIDSARGAASAQSPPADGSPGAYDLVIIGVGRDWGLKQRQFGINQEYFIRRCQASLLIVHKYVAGAAARA